MARPEEEQEIDLLELAGKIWAERRLVLKWCGIAVIVALVVAFSIPKEYTTTVMLAPEVEGGSRSLGGLSALAGMAGINVGAGETSDALYPDLYPDIVSSVNFTTELFDVPEWNVISTGGVSRERSFALVGPNTNRMISSYHVDKAIISCKAANMATGMMDSDEQDACSKRLMLGAAKERILVADNSKFDKMAFAKVADWTELTKVVTDREPSREWLREFERLRIECVYPGKEDGKSK